MCFQTKDPTLLTVCLFPECIDALNKLMTISEISLAVDSLIQITPIITNIKCMFSKKLAMAKNLYSIQNTPVRMNIEKMKMQNMQNPIAKDRIIRGDNALFMIVFKSSSFK